MLGFQDRSLDLGFGMANTVARGCMGKKGKLSGMWRDKCTD